MKNHRTALIIGCGLLMACAMAVPAQVDIEHARREHWAFQPIADPAPPAVKRAGRVLDPIDAFVLARLEAEGIEPAPPAARRTLIRRVYFDLIGLPPTYEQVEAFAADTSADAYEKVVDALLANPAFGERWGRHWLDVARYADTIGYDGGGRQRKFPFAWTYRDYVIRAFNDDKPYDRFLTEQIAADRLGLAENDPALAALGLLTVGRQFLGNVNNIADDQIDVVTRGMMSLTVQCSRCHDHKYDPIPTTDYYALHGVFRSIKAPDVDDQPIIGEAMGTAEQREAYAAELAKRRQAIEAHVDGVRVAVAKEARERGREYLKVASGEIESIPNQRDAMRDHYAKRWREAGSPKPITDEQASALVYEGATIPDLDAIATLRRYFNQTERDKYNTLTGAIAALQLDSPGAPPRAMVVAEGKPFEAYVFVRGGQDDHGPRVERRWLSVLGGRVFTDGSGRLELAQAVVSPDNPLTARVWANRVWMHLIGEGIVRTPGDFGSRGERPTHPQLLDHLATRLVREGWSTKRLIRSIVLSGTYRQSSSVPAGLAERDPENRLLARMNRERLTYEPMHDAALFVAGRLDATMYGRPVDLFAGAGSKRRAVYAYIDRQDLPQTLRAFDFASPDHSTPQRLETTVPQQALYLMNSPFVIEQAKAVGARTQAATEPSARIAAMYRIVLSRDPSAAEIELGRAYLGESPDADAWARYAQTLMLCNEFLFVD